MNFKLNLQKQTLNRMINENQVRDILDKVLMEQTSKVSRNAAIGSPVSGTPCGTFPDQRA